MTVAIAMGSENLQHPNAVERGRFTCHATSTRPGALPPSLRGRAILPPLPIYS